MLVIDIRLFLLSIFDINKVCFSVYLSIRLSIIHLKGVKTPCHLSYLSICVDFRVLYVCAYFLHPRISSFFRLAGWLAGCRWVGGLGV